MRWLGFALVSCLVCAGAADAKAPRLPKLGAFNTHVLAVVETYPTDGTHGYHWPKSGTWSGNTRTLHYDGKVLLEGDAKGRCHCCGLTFEVFLRAFERWTTSVKQPFKILDMTRRDVLRLKGEWFGVSGDRATLHTAITKNKLGVRITDWKQAKDGDFVQLWRYSGSGHSVVFRKWKRRGKKIIGITYWSSQGSTNGIGERTELFGDPKRDKKANGSKVKPDEFYLCRIGR